MTYDVFQLGFLIVLLHITILHVVFMARRGKQNHSKTFIFYVNKDFYFLCKIQYVLFYLRIECLRILFSFLLKQMI